MNEPLQQLIARCLEGDQRAWSELLERHAGLVLAVARECGLRPDQCQDVAQSVFGALARRLASIENAGALPAWLATSARRESWRVASAERRLRESAHSSAGEFASVGDDRLTALEEAHRVRESLRQMDDRCRDLLTALFLAPERPDYQVISARLGMPIGSIGPSRARCLAKLAQIMNS